MVRPYLGYVRVSRVGDRAETLISPTDQRGRIEAFAAARRLELVMLDPELDVSGGTVERPILSRAIELIELGEAAGIIVAQLDRLSRMSLVDALHTIRRIEAAGGEVLAAGEAFDVKTPEGRMGRNVFLSMAEMQLDRYKASFTAAKRQAVERGIWPMAVVPRGYRKGTDRRLEPGPDAPTIVRAFELRAAGQPWSVIADHLGAGMSGAMKTVRNRVYLGEIRVRGRVGAFNPSAHPPIIERALFEAAQLDHPRPARGASEALLLGLVRCAGCQRTMTPDTDVYRCFARNAGGRCGAPAIISRRLLEGHVEAALLARLAELPLIEATPRTDQLDQLAGSVEAAEAELEAFQRATSALQAEHFASGMRQRVESVEQARRGLAGARVAASPAELIDALRLWPDLSVGERRHVLRGALGVIWVRKGKGLGRVKLVAAGSEPADLSRPGRHAGAVVPLGWDAVVEIGATTPKDGNHGVE